MGELIEELIAYFTDQGVSRTLAIVYLAVSALLVIMALVAVAMRIVVFVKYQEGNQQQTSSGKSSCVVAREMLKKAGLDYVQVKKASWLRALFLGNSYSVSQKTIFLRRGIYNKNSITAVGLALQKVGIAKMCANGNKMVKSRSTLLKLNIFAPVLFVPIVLAGFLVDLIVFNTLGAFSVIGIAIGLFLVITGLIATMLNLPIEKQANQIALQTIKETGILNDQEQKIIEKVFDAYIIAYVCEFIVSVLRLIQIILEIVMNIQSNSSHN